MIDLAMMSCPRCGANRFNVFVKVGETHPDAKPGEKVDIDAPVYGVRCVACEHGQSWALGEWQPSKFVTDLKNLS